MSELGGLSAVLVRCGERVWQLAEGNPSRRGHGATAAAIWLDEVGGQVVHVGDCRDEALIGRVLASLGESVDRICAALMAEVLALEVSDNVTVVGV
jgi:serine/threonine protein phosphatase PrpC